MKFYISSRLGNAGQVRRVASCLKARGWSQTCDWTSFSAPHSPEGLREIGEWECGGIKEADVVIVLSPQGRGTHIELGMALALGKKVYIYHADDSYFKCDDNTSAFYWLPGVKQLAGELDAAIELILLESKGFGE